MGQRGDVSCEHTHLQWPQEGIKGVCSGQVKEGQAWVLIGDLFREVRAEQGSKSKDSSLKKKGQSRKGILEELRV